MLKAMISIILSLYVDENRNQNRLTVLLSRKTDLPVYIAEDPLQAVVRGTGITLKNIERYKTILIK